MLLVTLLLTKFPAVQLQTFLAPELAFASLFRPLFMQLPRSVVRRGAATGADSAEAVESESELQSNAKKVSRVQISDRSARTMWEQFCDKFGHGTRDPRKQPESMLLTFLDLYSKERVTNATLRELDNLKATPKGNVHWEWHIREHGFGLRNPRLMPESFVREFLSKYSEGSLPAVETASDEMLAQIDALIKKDPAIWKQWLGFCNLEGGGTCDPKLKSAAFLRHFIARYTEDKASAETVEEFKNITRANPVFEIQWLQYKDRNYVSSTRSPKVLPDRFVREFLSELSAGTLPLVEMASEDMVRDLRELCKDKAISKEWQGYCNAIGNGTRDPRRHPASFVQAFLARFAPRA